MKFKIILLISFFTSISQAFITQITALKKQNQTIFLLKDIHFSALYEPSYEQILSEKSKITDLDKKKKLIDSMYSKETEQVYSIFDYLKKKINHTQELLITEDPLEIVISLGYTKPVGIPGSLQIMHRLFKLNKFNVKNVELRFFVKESKAIIFNYYMNLLEKLTKEILANKDLVLYEYYLDIIKKVKAEYKKDSDSDTINFFEYLLKASPLIDIQALKTIEENQNKKYIFIHVGRWHCDNIEKVLKEKLGFSNLGNVEYEGNIANDLISLKVENIEKTRLLNPEEIAKFFDPFFNDKKEADFIRSSL